MKRKPTTNTKRKTVKKSAVKSIKPTVDLSTSILPFHLTFPYTLEYKEGKELKRCFFSCIEHLQKYIERYKLKKNTYKVFDTLPRNEEES